MNYSFSHGSGVPGIGITYSRWGTNDMNVLDENSLVESDGVKSTNPANPIPAKARTKYYCGDGTKNVVAIGKAADWNCNGRIDSARLAANIDWPKGEDAGLKAKILLSPSNDWASLLFAVGNIGVASGGLGGTPLVDQAVPVEQSADARTAEGADLAPIPSAPVLKVVSATTQTVTLQVSAKSTSLGTLTWAPIELDGTAGEQRAVAALSPGKSSVVRFTVSRADLGDAAGVVAFLDNTDWLVAGAVSLQ
jgi:hypothetical protein